MEEAFNLASKSIETTTFSSPVVFARRIHCNYRFHSARADRVDDTVGIVACVGDQGFAGRMLDELLRFGRVMLLTRSQRDVERFAFGRCDCVDLRGKTSSRTAQSIASDPPFPPAASWCARTMEPSMREPTSSTSICNRLKTRSQTPCEAHRAKRLYELFQGPYRSGMSRHGAPVFRRHITALTKFRSPRLDRGPRLTGTSGTIFSHCSSVSSCRCTVSVDQIFSRRATMICKPHYEPDLPPPALALDQEIRDTPLVPHGDDASIRPPSTARRGNSRHRR